MKPLGIVLLFINLLAAAGVTFLASQSWGKRHNENVAVLKHELTMKGLPSDTPAGAKPIDPSKAEEVVTVPGYGDIRVKVLAEHFQSAKREGNFASLPAVPLSLTDEVKDMQKVIENELNGLPTPVAKLAYLVGTRSRNNPNKLDPGVLTLLANDFEERETYRAWLAEAEKEPNALPPPVATPAELYDLARTALDAKFAEAIDKPNPGAAEQYGAAKLEARGKRDAAYTALMTLAAKDEDQRPAKRAALSAALLEYWKAIVAKTATLSDTDRRRKAAGLLAVLDTSPGGQKRTALLVGLSDYTTAVLDRTQRLTTMPERYERQGEAELASFTVVYEQRLATARDLDRLLQRQVDITKAFAAQEKLAADQVTTRAAHRDAAQGRVNDLDRKVKAASAAQEALEKEVFALQQLVGARFDELFRLEDQVFQAEKQKK
jgi:hypothetical protein